MRHWIGLCLLAGLAAASTAAGPLDGRWRLDEQRYGTGSGNLGELDREVRIVVAGDSAGSDVRLLAGAEGASYPWPSWVTDAGPARIELLDRRVDRGAGVLAAHYRVDAVAGDELVLDVEEHYTLDAAGASLAGQIRVRFTVDGADRGGFVVHRRFARES